MRAMISPRPDWSEKRGPWHLAEDFDDLTKEFGPERPFWGPVIKATVIIFVVMAFVFWAFLAPAKAHGWYTGERDPSTGFGCCGGEDCAPISEAEVKRVEGGFVYLPTGEFIPKSRVQQSHDLQFHRCVYLKSFEAYGREYKQGDTRCFFEPAGSV